MEPFCMKTKSPSFTAITSSLPCRRQWMAVTVNCAVFDLVIEVRHAAIRDQTDTLRFEPGLQGQNQGVVLVVDGSLDAGKSFNAGKFQHETVQVALEFNGTVPGLEGESGGPHVPEFRLEERGESQSVMQVAARASSSAWLSFSNSMRSCIENPIEATGTFARRLSTSLAIACDLCCSIELHGFVEY